MSDDARQSTGSPIEVTLRYTHSLGGLAPYFKGLEEGRAIASTCATCGRNLVPAAPRLLLADRFGPLDDTSRHWADRGQHERRRHAAIRRRPGRRGDRARRARRRRQPRARVGRRLRGDTTGRGESPSRHERHAAGASRPERPVRSRVSRPNESCAFDATGSDGHRNPVRPQHLLLPCLGRAGHVDVRGLHDAGSRIGAHQERIGHSDNESDIVKTEIRIVRKLRMLPQSVEYFLHGVVVHDQHRTVRPA